MKLEFKGKNYEVSIHQIPKTNIIAVTVENLQFDFHFREGKWKTDHSMEMGMQDEIGKMIEAME